MTLPPAKLDEIEKRCEMPNDGPWHRGDEEDLVVFGPVNEICVANDTLDALFIAHARQDLPACVAEIRRLRNLVSELRDLGCRTRKSND